MATVVQEKMAQAKNTPTVPVVWQLNKDIVFQLVCTPGVQEDGTTVVHLWKLFMTLRKRPRPGTFLTQRQKQLCGEYFKAMSTWRESDALVMPYESIGVCHMVAWQWSEDVTPEQKDDIIERNRAEQSAAIAMMKSGKAVTPI